MQATTAFLVVTAPTLFTVEPAMILSEAATETIRYLAVTATTP